MSTEYSNGYWGKIEYWTAELQKAIDNNNLTAVDSCHRKLDYFIQRQWDTKISVKETTMVEMEHIGKAELLLHRY
jgi:hypothetical protein